MSECPPLGDLLLAAEGTTSAPHKAAMASHLKQCPPCRIRLHQASAFLEASGELEVMSDEAGTNVGELDEVSELESISHVAAMNIGLDEGFGAEYDSEAKAEARLQEFTRRLHKQKQEVIHRQPAARIRQWLPIAALIPLLIVGLTFSRMQTVVRAEELLSRTALHERSLPAALVQRLRITWTPGIHGFASRGAGATGSATPRVPSFFRVRDVTRGVSTAAWPDAVDAIDASSAADADAEAMVAGMMTRNGFDFGQPINLAGVEAWRAAAIDKHDEVFVTGDLLVLRTTTAIGELHEVELTVRGSDYHIVKISLVFDGIGRVEIAEMDDSARHAAKAATPSTPGAPLAASPLGMTGVSAPALATRSAAALVPTPTTETSLAPAANVGQAGLSRWLSRTFGARPAGKTFVPDLQRLVGQVRQQLATLDTLARRYPETEVVEQWNTVDGAALHREVNDTYSAISRDLNELDARIGILYGSSSRALPVADAPQDWRRRAAAGLAQAEAMDREVRHLLTFDDLPSTDARTARTAPRVLATFGKLWEVVHAPAGGPANER